MEAVSGLDYAVFYVKLNQLSCMWEEVFSD